MSHRSLLSVAATILSVIVTSCGAGVSQPIAGTATRAVEATLSDSVTATPGSALSPSATTVEFYSIKNLDDGLDKLESYRERMTYTMEGKDATGRAQKMSIEVMREIVVASQDQHVKMSTTSTDAATNGGAVETFQVDDITYVYNPLAQGSGRCTSFTTRTSQAVNPASLFKPSEVLGSLQNARLVKSGDTLDGVTADQYSATDKDFPVSLYSTAKGDVWVARTGSYVMKYVGEATGKNTLPGANGDGIVKWDYRIEDADKIDAIVPPPECAFVRIARKTPVLGATPSTVITATVLEDYLFPANASGKATVNGITTFSVPDDLATAGEYYKRVLKEQGWTENLSSDDPTFIGSAYCSTPAYEAGTISLSLPQAMSIYSKDTRTLTIFLGKVDKGSSVMLMDSGT